MMVIPRELDPEQHGRHQLRRALASLSLQATSSAGAYVMKPRPVSAESPYDDKPKVQLCADKKRKRVRICG